MSLRGGLAQTRVMMRKRSSAEPRELYLLLICATAEQQDPAVPLILFRTKGGRVSCVNGMKSKANRSIQFYTFEEEAAKVRRLGILGSVLFIYIIN